MGEKWTGDHIANGAVADELKIGRDAPRPPWYAEENLPEIPLEQLTPEPWPGYSALMIDMQDVYDRVFRALQKHSLESTPDQRAKGVEQTASENQRDIAKLQSQLDELRVWVQERSDGVSNLGMRVAKLEDKHKEWRDRQLGINRDIYIQRRRENNRSERASIHRGDAADERIQARAIELGHRIDEEEEARKAMHRGLLDRFTGWRELLENLEVRIIAAVPSVGEQTQEEGDRG